jgi:hypothetical protein
VCKWEEGDSTVLMVAPPSQRHPHPEPTCVCARTWPCVCPRKTGNVNETVKQIVRNVVRNPKSNDNVSMVLVVFNQFGVRVSSTLPSLDTAQDNKHNALGGEMHA